MLKPFRASASHRIYSALLMAFCFGSSARASFVLNVVQSGNNVVASGTGTLNTAALTSAGSSSTGGSVWPAVGLIIVGPTAPVAVFTGVSGPLAFGSGGQTNASSGTGTIAGVVGNPEASGLYTPNGYVSNSSLSGTATWNNQTVAGLGLTPGTYVYTWGSGATADSFTVNIGGSTPPSTPSPTPAPSSLYLVVLGIVGFTLLQLYRSRRAPS